MAPIRASPYHFGPSPGQFPVAASLDGHRM